MTNVNLGAVILGIFTLLSVLVISNIHQSSVTFGAVARGSDYQATSTNGNPGSPVDAVLQSVPGTLGSVIITGANTGVIQIFDATTSNVALRTGQTASSTLLLAYIPASTAAGTYAFDRNVYNGIYLNVTGLAPTTTITYRQ